MPGSIGWKTEGVAEPATQFQQGHSIFPSFFVPEFRAAEFVFVIENYGLVFPLGCAFVGLQTNRASMLDEAIEYEKHLYLEVQVSKHAWMHGWRMSLDLGRWWSHRGRMHVRSI